MEEDIIEAEVAVSVEEYRDVSWLLLEMGKFSINTCNLKTKYTIRFVVFVLVYETYFNIYVILFIIILGRSLYLEIVSTIALVINPAR